MATYGLYLESGPRRRKTMVHVLQILGCVAVGPTTDDALAATPEAIRAYLRFLDRCGEKVDLDAPIETQIVEHITEGIWLGNGSPYILYGPDLEPVTDAEMQTFVGRHLRLREELATWAESLSDEALDAVPAGGGRTARAILLHVIGPTGPYLSASLGTAPGFGRWHGKAERGEVPLSVALRETAQMAADRLLNTTPEERRAIREREAGRRTLRQSIRRLLEHDWEHLAELSRRPGGPTI